VEYKKESYDLFEDLMNRIDEDSLRFLFLLQPVEEKKVEEQIERKQKRQEMVLNQMSAGEAHQAKRDASKVGRNDPCPCGSGKKFKKCHGAEA
jgi:preprotein translocase subunit SecA